MAEGRISISYVVNANEFNSNVSQMKKNMQLCNQEIKNSAKEINLYGNNIQNLSNKQKAIQQAIDQSNKIIKAYSDNIEKNKKALANNSDELQKLATKKKEANKAYKDAVKNYGEESEEAKKLKQALNDVSQEYVTMQSRVKGNKNAITTGTNEMEKQRGVLLDLQNELKNVSNELENQSNKFIQASEKFAEYGTKLESMGGKMKNLGSEVQQAGALIVGAAGTLATFAASAETGFAKVNTLARDSGKSLENFKKDVYNLSNDTGQSLETLTDGIYNAISAGVSYSDSTKFMEKVNKVAVGGFGEINDAVSSMTALMNIYGYTVDDVSGVSDKLFNTQEKGVLTVGELSNVLGESASSAKAYNVDLDNLLSGYVSLTKAGINVNQSNTKLRAMFEELGDTGSKVGEIIQNKTGKSFTTLMDEGSSLADVMGILVEASGGSKDNFNALWSSSEAASAGFIIADENGKVFSETLKSMENSAGKCDDAFKKVADTSEFKFKKSLNEIKNSASKLGEALLPVLDDVSKGISDLAKYISKLDPDLVKGVAKFGAYALAIGGVTKVTGSLVGGLGKGAKAISTVFKLVGDTKSLGSFSKALSNIGTSAGETASSSGGLGSLIGLMGQITPTGGLIGGAIAGVAALGYAFYENQKEIEESETKLAEMADCYDDFTGRIRTNENIWTEIFGKEYNIKFGSDYKQALANTESDVAEWVEKLRGMQENINALLNDTSKSDETKQKELEQMVQLVPENNNKEEHKQQFKSGLEEAGITGESQEKYLNLWSEAYDEAQQVVDNGERKIAEIIRNNLGEDGNITEEGMKQIEEVRKDVQDEMAQVQSTDFDTQLAMTESHFAQEEAIYKGAEKGTVEAIRNKYKTMNDERIKDLENEKKFIDERAGLSEQEKQVLKDNINNQINDINTIEQAQMASLNRRAMYDQEYAKQNGLAVQQINDNMWTVIDTNTGIETSFFETEAAMQQYADSMGLQTSYISDEFGNMHMVIQDAGGGIVGMLDSSATSFGFFGNEAWAAMQQVIDQAGVTQGTAEQKFAAICNAIDNGTLKAEEFGFTSSEEFKAAANEMVNAGGSADNLKGKINNLPKNTNVKVETKIEGESALDNLIGKLGSFAGKVFTATAKVATQGIDAISGVLGKKETGGTIQESGVYNINEAGTELVDSFGTSATSNYSLGSAVRGEYAYLEQGTKVTNALMTTQKMKNMVSSEVALAVNMAVNGMKREIIDALKTSGNDNKGFNITMNDPHFENKGSENANVSNIKRIVNSLK